MPDSRRRHRALEAQRALSAWHTEAAMVPDLVALGAKVRDARRRMGLTQQQLSERVDCSPEWISKIERGRARPSLTCINGIGHALGTDLTVLLADKGGPNGSRTSADYGASLLRALDDQNREVAIALLEALLRRQRDLEADRAVPM